MSKKGARAFNNLRAPLLAVIVLGGLISAGTFMHAQNADAARNRVVRHTDPVPVRAISFSPISGSVGTKVTLKGLGFTATGNTVNFAGIHISGISSADGQTLTFRVPQGAVVGHNSVTVTNGSGMSSNPLDFFVFTQHP